MKKTILLFLVILSGMAFSQTNGLVIGDRIVWSDSVGYGTGAAGTATASDSVWILKSNNAYKMYRIFLGGNAHSPVDSVALQLGSIRYGNNGAIIDTIWSAYTGLKIAAGTIVVRMVNTSSGADFLLEYPCSQLMKFNLMNYRLASKLRNVPITINAIK